MLIISHTDANQTDTATFPTKHKHIYEKNYYLSKKPIAKLLPHQMTVASQRASRESDRIQINNIPLIYDFFFWDVLILFVTLHATKRLRLRM